MVDQQALTVPKSELARTKIADGEYAIVERADFGAVGPFGEEIYDFRETWTIWRTETGSFEVEGHRRFESPKGTPHDNRFVVRLSRDLTVIEMTEFANLKWRPDSGPLSCVFLSNDLHCSSGGREPANKMDLHIPMQHPFGLLWPISAFSISGIVRQAERDPAHVMEVQLARIEQPDNQDPVEVTALNGRLRYLGQDDIELAGARWQAYKFLLKPALQPQSLIWVSPRGLLLSLAVEHPHKDWSQEGMKLVSFHKWADF